MSTTTQSIEQIKNLERRKSEGQLTLGQFVEKLETICEVKPDSIVYFDFGDLLPVDFVSWRGDYSECALEWSLNMGNNSTSIKVKDLLQKAKATIGARLKGYKGGKYKMTENTFLWAARDGESTQTAITDVRLFDTGSILGVQIITQVIPYWVRG